MQNKQLTQALSRVSADETRSTTLQHSNALHSLAEERAALQKKRELIEKFNAATKAATDVLAMERKAIDVNFGRVEINALGITGAAAELGLGGLALQNALAQNDPISGAILFSLSGLSAGIVWACGRTIHGAAYAFTHKERALEYAISDLPEGPEKDLYTQFNKESKAAFELERATYLHHKKGPGNRKGRKILEKALKEMGATPEQAAALRNRYKSGDFYSTGEFLKALEKRYEELQTATNSLIVRTLEKSDSKPALPPVPDIP